MHQKRCNWRIQEEDTGLIQIGPWDTGEKGTDLENIKEHIV